MRHDRRMTDIHLDPDRLRVHAARADRLAEELSGCTRRDHPAALGGRDAAVLERIDRCVEHSRLTLIALADDLRVAARGAETVDLAQRDLLRGAGHGEARP